MNQTTASSMDRLEPLTLLQKIEELESRNTDLLAMLEKSFDALAIVDGESTLLYVNPAFEQLIGAEKGEVVGRRIADMVEEGLTDTAASLKVIETSRQQTVLIKTKTGRQVLSTGVPVFSQDGSIHRIYCNLRDITGLNELKEKYEQSQTLLSKYLCELNAVKLREASEREFVAHDIEMRKIVETVYRVGQVDATLLVLGESGVGKELIARMAHEASPRNKTGSFVKINCGAIPGELLESELFGYESGAFTGANRDGKPGYFEVADKGTLFLDEIGDLPLNLQVKLLSVLQDQKLIRVGGTKPKTVDVRIIAATNRNLDDDVSNGRFRKDLFYRLNVVPIQIPPLRKRRDDIGFLLVHFLERYNKKYGRGCRMSPAVIDLLQGYSWPGNVRELSNLVEHLVVVVGSEMVEVQNLPRKYVEGIEGTLDEEVLTLRDAVKRYELNVVQREMARSATMEEAAHKLGVSLSTLARRLRQCNIDRQK